MKIRTLASTITAIGGLMFFVGCASHQNQAGTSSDRSSVAQEQGLVSPGSQFSGLPPAVQNTVRAKAGAAEIIALLRQTNGSLVLYKFYFRNPKMNPPLIVASDGSLLNPDLSVAVGAPSDSIGVGTGGLVAGLKLDDLPPNVVKTIQARAPKAEVASIQKEMRGDAVVYVVSFKDQSQNPNLLINADGSVRVDDFEK